MILEWFIQYVHVVQCLLNTCLSSVCSKSTSNHCTILLDRLLPLIRGLMYLALLLSSQHVPPRGWNFAQDGWHTTTTKELIMVINRLEYDRLQGTTMEYKVVDAKDHVTKDHMAVANNHVTLANDNNALVNNQNDVAKKCMTKYNLFLLGICLCCDHYMLLMVLGHLHDNENTIWWMPRAAYQRPYGRGQRSHGHFQQPRCYGQHTLCSL